MNRMVVFELHNGDCLEVMKDISSNSIDLIICDLPYGCLEKQGRSEESRKKYNRGNIVGANKGCAWDIKIDLEAFWKEVKRIRRNKDTPTLHFCTTKFGYDLIESNKKEFRHDLVWDKGRGVSFLSANKMPMRSHEMIYVFSKEGAYYNRVDITGSRGKETSRQYGIEHRVETQNEGKRCVLSVIHNPTSSTKDGHPTEKPVDLYKFLIERYCPAGGTVLDPTFGSCNSGRAAESLGRSYIGIEKDEGFFKKAAESLGCL